MNESVIIEQAKKYDSFYLYDENVIIEQIENLKHNFYGVHFLYSVKANPNPMIVKTILKKGFGVDVSSVAEVSMGIENGLCKDEIYYSAPGKTANDIEKTIESSILIADSISEIELINGIAKRIGIIAEIGIRINPNFSFDGDVGQSSKFGIDEDLFFEWILYKKKYANIRIIGVHVHIGSQQLDTEIMIEYYKNMFRLIETVQKALGRKLKFVNMGSGIGIQYAATDKLLDIEKLGVYIKNKLHKFHTDSCNTKIIIETGRYVVGRAGIYVTKVLDRKISHGVNFVILKNTMNGFFRLSLSQLVAKYAKTTNPINSEPLFTHYHISDFIVLGKDTPTEKVTLVGNLCTVTDIVAENIELPKLKRGDVVVMTNAGSYGATLSPMQFSSQEYPVELFLTQNGSVVV